MDSKISFALQASGQPFKVPNGLLQNSGNLGAVYTVSGAPATLSIVVEGIKNAAGTVVLLDTYTGTTSTTRSIALSDTYDSFRVTAIWTGGLNVQVASVFTTTTGSGPTFSAAQNLVSIHTQ
jgi:hypothetical protein